MKPKTRHDNKLPVEKIIREFEEEDAKPGHRGDRFEIDVHFDDAVRKIAGARPEVNPKKRSR